MESRRGNGCRQWYWLPRLGAALVASSHVAVANGAQNAGKGQRALDSRPGQRHQTRVATATVDKGLYDVGQVGPAWVRQHSRNGVGKPARQRAPGLRRHQIGQWRACKLGVDGFYWGLGVDGFDWGTCCRHAPLSLTQSLGQPLFGAMCLGAHVWNKASQAK